ncbi:MAG: MFS transporter [Proteobacteria bacterium]|nr:MFS transporter [Pseudomonadota bacterium]
MTLPLVVVLGIVGIGVSYNQRMLDPLTVLLARDLAAEVSNIVLLSPAFTLPYALGQPILGPVADAVGKARVLRLCMATIIASAVATLFVTNYPLLVALRMLAGLAAGGIIPVSLALIADRTPVEERQVAMSHFMLVLIVSQIFTAPVSAYVAQKFHWHATVIVALVLAAFAYAMLLWRVKPNSRAVRTPFSAVNAVRTYRTILADPRARTCYAAVLAEGIFIFGITPHIAPILEQRGLGGATEAGYVLAGMGGGGILYALSVTRLVRRFDIFTLMRAGGVLVATGLFATALSLNWQMMVVAYAILGFGFYMLHSGLQTRVTEVIPTSRASVVSLHAFFMFLGIAGGPILFGWADTHFGLLWPLLVFAAGILIASTGAASRLKRLDAAGARSEA